MNSYVTKHAIRVGNILPSLDRGHKNGLPFQSPQTELVVYWIK